MKTGFGLLKKYRQLIAYINLFRFTLHKYLLGFDFANQFIQRVDSISLILILKKNGAIIKKNCDIQPGIIFHNCKDYSNLEIGNNCHIGRACFFDLRDKILLMDNVVVSMQCTFITHLDLTKSDLSGKFPPQKNKIVIHENCYLGANCTLLSGVILNKSSVVAAKSLVNKDVPEYTIVGGIPAKLIRSIER